MSNKFFKILFISVFSIFVSCQESDDSSSSIIPIVDEPIDTIISEIELNALGKNNTYSLINNVFAPGYSVIEAPDCSHPEFGEHIDEIYDTSLKKYVFRFFIHTTPDNDRCINFDRQRNEIKAYDKSPSGLKGIQGEKVNYSWKFKLSDDFKSSSKFTHIHQIKAVGGTEESMPLITFTTRKGTPDKLELRYSENTSQITLIEVDLEPFKGNWIEASETIVYGEQGNGTYKVTLRDYSSKSVLLNYENLDIRMWKTEAQFMRPKWGIYRSLLDDENLKDETILFSDFNIKEIKN